jgi:hypothetical protein
MEDKEWVQEKCWGTIDDETQEKIDKLREK